MTPRHSPPPAPGWPPDWPDITDPAVIDAMRAVPRHRFVPPSLREHAYEDEPLPIGHGQTISQPYIVALMTQALAVTEQSRILEIGTGSGYQTAILSHLSPHVYSLEAVAELAEAAARRLAELGYHAQTRIGDGWVGWPERAPYDGIIVTAAAAEPPPALVQQLAQGGRLVVPVGEDLRNQVLWLIRKRPVGLTAQRLADVRFVPLVRQADDTAGNPDLAEVRRQLRAIM